jgi:hypothetical protein
MIKLRLEELTARLQAIITANRDRTGNAALSQKEMASMLGVSFIPVNSIRHTVSDQQHDPAKWSSKAKERFDPQVESDIYDKLPLEAKVKRLENALSHSDQCTFI